MNAMHCPVCDSKTKVYGTRELHDGSWQRYHKCKQCGRKFTSRAVIKERIIKQIKAVLI